MRLTDAEIRKLPVFTVKGERLGRVSGLVVDPASHSVVQYVVARPRLSAGLLPKRLFVHVSQVISLDNEKMVVKDETLLELEMAAAVMSAAKQQPQEAAAAAQLSRAND